MHPRLPPYATRRDFLAGAFNGLGSLALGGLLAEQSRADRETSDPLTVRRPHHRRKAKHCIFLFMQGGVSQIDSFEYKPILNELHGKPLPRMPSISGELQGRLSFPHVCIGSEFEFRRHGESGRYVSELFPNLARHVDDLAFIHGIKTDNQNHGPSTLHVMTGSQFPGLFGLDEPRTAGFARQCLLARRLAESGVRYTLLVHGVQIGGDSWDHHGAVASRMRKSCGEVDQPVAALLADLKQRGLLEETLVVWASEMGRTPFKNGGLSKNPGREHNSRALCMWMAGGDVQGGATAGATDEFSLRAAGEPIPIRDVHATILDLMGLSDDELRYLHAGCWRQLTDIGGQVIQEIVA